MLIVCPQCGDAAKKASGAVNRSRANGSPVYCSRVCSGLARRDTRTLAEKRDAKSEYDRQRRKKLGEELLAKKRAAYRANVEANPVGMRAKEREWRKLRADKHVEYCRQPKYREWKRQYDRQYKARKDYGEFAECALVLRDIEVAVLDRASRYELNLERGLLNKCKKRKREYEKAIGC